MTLNELSPDGSTVCAVIVNYGRPDDTCRALEALERSDGISLVGLVVDNNVDHRLSDELTARLNRRFGVSREREGWRTYAGSGALTEIRVRVGAGNAGYAAACNAGFREAAALGSTYVWFLNNDVLVGPTAGARLVRFMDQRSAVGVAGCMILGPGPGRNVECVGGARLGSWTLRCRFATAEAGVVDYISGAAMFARSAAVEQVGGIPEQYFLFFEDVEFSHLIRSAGYELAVVPDAEVTHLGGRTTGSRARIWDRSSLCTYYSSRNAIWFARAHRSRRIVALVAVSRGAVAALLLLRSPRTGVSAVRGLLAGLRRGKHIMAVGADAVHV